MLHFKQRKKLQCNDNDSLGISLINMAQFKSMRQAMQMRPLEKIVNRYQKVPHNRPVWFKPFVGEETN